MKKYILRALSLLFITTIISTFLSGCTITKNNTSSNDTILVGLDDSFPPMGFRNSNNELQGFDIDMANELGKRLNKKFEFHAYSWDGIILGLKQKKFDLIISAMSITKDREKEIAFSNPYIMEKQVIVTKKDKTSINSPEDLKGKIVGVQLGSTSSNAVESIKNSFKGLKEYNENINALRDLELGRTDAVVVDELVARYYIKNKKNIYRVADKELTKEPIAIGIRKEDTKLKESIDNTLKKMKEDGTLDKISKKWFGESIIER